MRRALILLFCVAGAVVGQDEEYQRMFFANDYEVDQSTNDYEVDWGIEEDDVWNDFNGSSSILFIGNTTDDANSSAVVISNRSAIDLSLQQGIEDLGNQLIDLISGMIGGESKNDTSWTFVSFITLVPIPCSAVRSVASLFDQAMATTNPSAEIVSVPRRLGGLPCSTDGTCPCSETGNRRKYVTRVMELSSRSRLRSVAYPLSEEFPYHVAIQPLPVF